MHIFFQAAWSCESLKYFVAVCIYWKLNCAIFKSLGSHMLSIRHFHAKDTMQMTVANMFLILSTNTTLFTTFVVQTDTSNSFQCDQWNFCVPSVKLSI